MIFFFIFFKDLNLKKQCLLTCVTCDNVTPFLCINYIYIYLPKLPSITTSNLEKGEISICDVNLCECNDDDEQLEVLRCFGTYV